MIIQQIFLGLIFLVLSLLIFTIPGWLVLKKLKISLTSFFEIYTLSTVLGLGVFTLTAYILAALNLRFLMWGFVVVGLLSVVFYRKNLINFDFDISKKLLVPFILVLVVGVLGQVAVNAGSGFSYSDGVYFYSSHGHDGVWHLSLMEEFHKNSFPFQNPEYGGHKLQNYHFFVDLLMSEITRLFHFSNLDVYFRFVPTLFSILLGFSGFIFVRAWAKSEWAGFWSMIFIYFAGSFGYLLTIIRDHTLGGEALFWVTQTQSILGNPPHAAAFIILTTFMFCLLKYLQMRKLNYLLIGAFLGGIVIEFKVYGGVLVLGGVLIISIWEIIFKRSFKILIFLLITSAIALSIYLPNSENSQDFLIWEPWWYIRTMVVAPDRLNWLDLELRRQTYISEGNIKRVIQLEVTAFLIFLIGNLGMRFVGIWSVFKIFKANIFKNPFNLFFISITFASFLIPLFFLQMGVVWNSIQFNQYFLLLFGFLASITTAQLLGKVKPINGKIIISLILIILMVPTQVALLWNFYKSRPLSKVTYEEIKALKFLKENSNQDALILTAPFNNFERDKYYPPLPIYSWYDTGYVPAFSGRRTLISDQEQVNIMGYKAQDLLKEKEEAFIDESGEKFTNFLIKYNVDFIYLVWGQQIKAPVEKLPVQLVYKSANTMLYKVKKL